MAADAAAILHGITPWGKTVAESAAFRTLPRLPGFPVSTWVLRHLVTVRAREREVHQSDVPTPPLTEQRDSSLLSGLVAPL